MTVSGTIKDTSGQLVPGATVRALWAGTTEVVASTDANANGVYSLTLSEGTYDLRYRGPEGSGIGANLMNRDLSQDAEINVAMGQVGITLSGVLGDGTGLSYGYVNVYDANWAQVGNAQADSDGTWSIEVMPGTYRVNAYYSDRSGGNASTNNEPQPFTADTTVAVHPPSVPVSVNLLGADGQPADGQARLECNLYYPDKGSVNHASTARGTGTITVHGLPTPNGQTCGLSVDPDEGPIITQRIEVPENGTSLDVTIQPGITLSGVLGDGTGLSYGYVNVYDANWAQVGNAQADSDGTWSIEVMPGTYRVNAYYSDRSGGNASTNNEPQPFTADTTVAVHPPSVPVSVNLLGADGQPADGQARLECNLYYPDKGSVNHASTARGTGTITVHGLPTPNGQTCGLSVDPDEGPIITQRIEVPENGATLTIFTFGGGIVIAGDTDTTNDGDNVADAVEALAPNNGDGNNDGTPDYEQENVTSLPVNGGSLGSGANYVTVAAPDGTKLSNVFTVDPSDTSKIETPPPPNVTLPEGLTNLVLENVETGTNQTISIFTASTQDVTGYAKYNPDTKQWSLLPDNRVRIFDNRVEITLTDGGIGDDDGVANGRISDPGGIAIVRNLDTVAPTVTGQASSQPNANGWYDNDVTVNWTATDPEPSSGMAAQPQSTIVQGEGNALAAESAQVCDNAGNCSTGKVDGIKIDRTKPTIEVSGVADGETYTLGAVPVASCSASDDLSGVDGSCTGTLTGGTSTGVGEFTYEVTAQDKAGNERQKSITYNVEYRFDGFLPPVNDPVFTKWDFKSVLRSGWPVPALFQVKKADGSLVQPGSAPEWLTPQKGKAINAPVNEEQPEESPTSGKTYVKILGVWTYVWNTRGVERGYEYRLGVKLDDGTKHYVVVAVK